MHPDLLRWGFVHVTSYGLMLAIAFLAGTGLSLREARRRGLDEDALVTAILVALLAAVAGARALYVVEHLSEFRGNPGAVLALWQGGLTLYGGIVAGVAAGLIAARRLRLPMWTAADAVAPAFALGTMFGRIGCFLNGCCYGRPTRLPWGVVFPPDSFASLEFGPVPVHPSQLYFAAAGLGIFLVAQSLRDRLDTPGTLFWTTVALLALVRIPLDFTRVYDAEAVVLRAGGFDVTESQITSVLLVLFALLMIARLRRLARPAPTPAPATP